MKWSVEKKKTILDIHRLPTADGKPVTVKEICRRYGIAENTFYRWARAYEKDGIAGLEPRNRNSYQSSSKAEGTLDAILTLAQQNPEWSPRKISEYLFKQGVSISIPTIRARLQEYNLGTQIERYAAAERSYILNRKKISEEVVQLIRKHNHCFDDFVIAKPDLGNTIFLGVIKFNHPKFSTYRLLVGLDLQSSYTIVELCNREKAKEKAQSFGKECTAYFFQCYKQNHITVFYNPRSYYESVRYMHRPNNGKLFRKYPSEIANRSNAGAYEHFREEIKIAIVSAFDNGLTCSEHDLKEWVQKWVEEYNLRPGKLNYPTFGQPPVKVFESITK